MFKLKKIIFTRCNFFIIRFFVPLLLNNAKKSIYCKLIYSVL